MSLEQRLARIEARAEIADLIALYARGADRKNDPAIMAPLFAKDGVWSAEGFARFEGRDEIARGLAAIAAERVLWSIHFMMSPLIRLSDTGDTASCQWYLWELCTMQTDDGPKDHWLGGWYDSRVRLTEEGWKFSEVKLDVRLEGEAAPSWAMKKPVID